jgi:hypothetical protein
MINPFYFKNANYISPLSVKSLIFCKKYFNLISETPFVSRDCERFYFNPTYIPNRAVTVKIIIRVAQSFTAGTIKIQYFQRAFMPLHCCNRTNRISRSALGIQKQCRKRRRIYALIFSPSRKRLGYTYNLI